MPKKILTLDNLYQFFVEQNKSVDFSAKESGVPIVVKTNGFFEANEGDIVLLAGKGHETYQIIGTEKIHYDEREVVKSLLR